MSDTIYRQAAIDALNMADDKGQIHSILDVNDVIKSLPSAQPERKQVEIEYTAWNEELYGQSAICGNCGCTWQIGNNGEDNFCPNCGARMIRGGKDNDE